MNTPNHDNGSSNNSNSERLADIIARMEARFSKEERQHTNDPASQASPAQPELLPALRSNTLPTTPEYIRSEQFLEVSGFFTPSSKRIEHLYTKEKKLKEYTDEHGTKKILKTKISANHELGLPITSDLDYYRAFLKILDEIVDRDGRFRLPVPAPSVRLARYAGKQWSERTRKEIRAWLKRMTGTLIEGAVYRAKKKNYDDGFTGTVFSQVVTRGEALRNGETADTNYVWLSPWFLSNYYYRYTRPLDFAFYKQLRKPIAKSLYTLLENGWYASDGKPYTKSYRALCDEFLLAHYPHLSKIKEQLDPAHRELQHLGLIASWDYHRTSKGDDYIITYLAGQKFFRDQQEKESRQTLMLQIENGHHEDTPTPPQLDLIDRTLTLLSDILTICGDTHNAPAYKCLIKEHPEALIRMALSETNQAHREGRILKTKGAYFTDTLKRLAQYRCENGHTV